MDHQAFAQLLGNYGEFVGAFAVVATLVYLAIQIKSARVASEASHIAVSGQHSGGVRERFIENAELWIKGNSGGKLNTVEQFAFDQLVESMAEVHFFAFVRTRTLGGSLDERIPASNLAEFLHRYPVAYERWQAQEDTYVGTRRAMGIPESANALGDDWIRMVTDAVATLEKSE
jgi:hypothetical protein